MTSIGSAALESRATSWPVAENDAAHSPRRAALCAGVALALVYGLSAAPGITWWDAGEFVAATETLGIPHPPGTPLYIIVANVWASLFGFLDRAHAVNLFSAACTAVAGASAAGLLARATRSTAMGVAGAVCAGTMSTAWSSATEAEVYGPSLMLAMLMLLAADRAGRTGEGRWAALTAYLFALAAPLHVTALVAAPAAIVLAATKPDGGVRRDIGIPLAAAFVAVGALGTGRWWLAGITFAALVGVAVAIRPARAMPVIILIAISAYAFMLVRAQHDPGINQGNPSTVAALLGVIARDQYIIAGVLPRQAPVWLQVVNFLEYADWQVALGLGPTVTPTVARMVVTVMYIGLGVVGFIRHRRTDPRSWRALALLGLCGSFGVLIYLNLKAGPSIGYGIIPDDTPHEPRERDYFFAFAFWTWGLWAGIGAVELTSRWLRYRRTVALAAGLALAAAPTALNWPALDRRREPEASLPRRFAEELLAAAPPRAVLLVAGDNDTYPLWYLQQAEGVRRDVTVITYPLVGAAWYRDELYRRSALGAPQPHAGWNGMRRELTTIATSARAQGRPLAAAITVERAIREHMAPRWRLAGLVYVVAADSVADLPAAATDSGDREPRGEIVIDRLATEAAAARLEPILRKNLRPAIDPTARLMRASLECPAAALRARVDSAAAGLLESTCNSR